MNLKNNEFNATKMQQAVINIQKRAPIDSHASLT